MRAPRAPSPALDFASWIVWEDEGLVAIDKPAGVLSQGGEGGAGINVVDLARAYYGKTGLGVLHRIDRNVSGLVLVAKTPQAASAMTTLFAKGKVERVYRAVVRGAPKEDALVFDAWLAKNEKTNEVRAVDASKASSAGPGGLWGTRPRVPRHDSSNRRAPKRPSFAASARPSARAPS